MKKIIAVIIAILMLMLASACSDSASVGVIGGVDGPTAIIITGADEDQTIDNVLGEDGSGVPEDIEQSQVAETELPTQIVAEYTYNNDEYCTYNMTVQALDASGSVMWEYTTPDSPVGQCDSLQYLGMENGKVFITEINVSDEPIVDMMSFSESRLRALSAADGSVVWDNTEFHGAGASAVFDEDGNIYVTGYFGPDCMKVSKTGDTLWIVRSVDEDLYWVYDIDYENREVIISYEMNENGEGQKVRISADGEVLG